MSAPGHIPFLGSVPVVGPRWVTGRMIEICHRHERRSESLVRLDLGEDEVRSSYVREQQPDYEVILSAVRDAYVTGMPISLELDGVEDGATIERFRFAAAPGAS